MATNKGERGPLGTKTEHSPQHFSSYSKSPTFSKETAELYKLFLVGQLTLAKLCVNVPNVM